MRLTSEGDSGLSMSRGQTEPFLYFIQRHERCVEGALGESVAG